MHHISSGAPCCPTDWRLLDTSHISSGMFPTTQRSGTVPSLSSQSQHTIFYATIFVVGSNGLVSGTSAGSKTPFVGIYTTQLASYCRLLKPQPGTALQVWLRAELKKTPKPTEFASDWYQSCSALPCKVRLAQNPRTCDIPLNASPLPQILFLSEEPEWMHGCGKASPPATPNYRGALVCISKKTSPHTDTFKLTLYK